MASTRRRRRVHLEFPENYRTHRYNRIHFSFFLQMAQAAGVEVTMTRPDSTVFIGDPALIWGCRINGQAVIVDYSDHWYRDWTAEHPNRPYFKFQKTAASTAHITPLGPPMVGGKRRGIVISDLNSYLDVRRDFDYRPGNIVACKQLPNGAAVERRNLVHDILRTSFSNIDIDCDSDQIDFWRIHETVAAAVCVPGANNNMIDRGHMELMGLGVCTVSPRLDTMLPFGRQAVPGQHYVMCQDDYSDLVTIVQDLIDDPDRSRSIAQQARALWDELYAPDAYWRWIIKALESHRER